MQTAVWISMDETLARISLTLACGNSRRVSGERRFHSTRLSVEKALISAVGLGKRTPKQTYYRRLQEFVE